MYVHICAGLINYESASEQTAYLMYLLEGLVLRIACGRFEPRWATNVADQSKVLNLGQLNVLFLIFSIFCLIHSAFFLFLCAILPWWSKWAVIASCTRSLAFYLFFYCVLSK